MTQNERVVLVFKFLSLRTYLQCSIKTRTSFCTCFKNVMFGYSIELIVAWSISFTATLFEKLLCIQRSLNVYYL